MVVPSYNHVRFVETTLRSIIKQSTPPKELLVIDDGSSDNSPHIIERVLRDCPFPSQLIARENRGLCATLNEGLAKTSGNFFAYLGSDDLWLPDFLRERVSLLESRPNAVLAYGHAYFVDEENRIVDSTSHWANYVDGDARQMLLQTIAPMSPTVLYRRDALQRHSWNDKAQLEDYELYLRLSTDGDFAFDNRVLSAWRRHRSNTSWDQRLMLDEQLEAQRRVLSSYFGKSANEINRLHKEITFNRAEDFLRVGDKRTALRLMTQNLAGVKSASTLARMVARLLVPYGLIQRRQARRQKNSAKHYGVIEV